MLFSIGWAIVILQMQNTSGDVVALDFSSYYLCPKHPISSRESCPLQASIKEKEVALYAWQKQSTISSCTRCFTVATFIVYLFVHFS